jgi:hypothetical protein
MKLRQTYKDKYLYENRSAETEFRKIDTKSQSYPNTIFPNLQIFVSFSRKYV